MDSLLAVIAYVVGTEFAAAFAMITAPTHFQTAKRLFWASAILLGFWCFAWELTTEAVMTIRVAIGFIVGMFVFVVVPETIRHFRVLEIVGISTRAEGNAAMNSSEDKSIVGISADAIGGPGSKDVIGADISVDGHKGDLTPPIGADINVQPIPGHSVTGMRATATAGPDTPKDANVIGMKVRVGGDGPATGVRLSIGTKPPNQ